MSHKQILCGLMPGGRLRMEKLSALITSKRIDPSLMLTHRFTGFENVEPALMLMKDKPKELIKPVVLC
jgi:threonine dehydrogenase-like Zn-dependent dehydrogenase